MANSRPAGDQRLHVPADFFGLLGDQSLQAFRYGDGAESRRMLWSSVKTTE